MIEPLGEAMRNRRLERIVMQNRRIDEGGELRLTAHSLFGLAAKARPNRIDRVERRLSLRLRHRISPRLYRQPRRPTTTA